MLLSKAMGKENQEAISVLLLNVYYFSDYLLRMQGLWDFVNDDYGNIVRNVKKNLPWQEWALKKKQGKCFERPAYIYVWKQTMRLLKSSNLSSSECICTLFLYLSWINSAFVMVIRRSDIIWCCHFLNSCIVWKTNWQRMLVLKY